MEVAWIEYKPRPPKRRPRRYGLSNFVGDITLTFATFGLWAIWWIIREVCR